MSSFPYRKRKSRKAAKSSGVPATRLPSPTLSRRLALISGISLALSSGGVWAAQFGSPAWFAAQRGGVPAPAAQVAAPNAPSNNLSGRVVTPDQALVRAQRSIQNLSRAAQIIASAQTAQNAARQLALNAPSNVPNGLQAGGLQVAPGVTTDPSLWQNAELPTQTVDGAQTLVTVEQTGGKAILTWDTFNVGRDTTLHFDQTRGTQGDGTNAWIALNRVLDTQAAPSQILGSIKAEGSVYVINRNGVVFGGASQVNTHSFLASSLSLFSEDVATSNDLFLRSGINEVAASASNFALGGHHEFTSEEAIDNWQRPGDIEIQAGAQLASGANGYMLIAAPNVRNAGTILAADGQAILAAGLGLKLNPLETQGALANFGRWTPYVAGTIRLNGVPTSTGLGTLENTGLIGASRGNVSLVGYNVQQSGVVQATTSVSRPGSLYIAAQDSRFDALDANQAPLGGILNFSSSSLTAILPEADGETTTSGSAADLNFVAPAAILGGAQLSLQENALVLAPGATVDLLGWGRYNSPLNTDVLTERIDIARGAVIDVAGLADVQLAMSANQVTIPRVGLNELADSRLQRDGLLYTELVTVDGRLSGTRSDGLRWFGSPLLNIGGYIENQPREIDQLLTDGGTIDIIGRELVTHAGSLLNLDGGYVHFLGGRVQTTRLLGADGQIYDISQADPNMRYSGIAGQHQRDYSRWNVSETYVDPLLSGRFGRYETDYIVGGSGGTLNLAMSGPTLLGGEISAQAFSGRYQIDQGQPAEAGHFNFGVSSALLRRSFNTSFESPFGLDVIVTRDGPSLPVDFGLEDPASSLPGSELQASDPSNPLFWTTLSATQLNEAGFAHVTIGNENRAVEVQEGAHLAVQDGGSIDLSGARVEVYGDLTARSGDISVSASGQWGGATIPVDAETGLQARGDVIVGSAARLDARGQWVNDALLGIDEQTGAAHIDGGSITLTTHQLRVNASSGPTDWSGSLTLEAGAVLDVSGGGYVQSNGALAVDDNVPLGRGGDIALLTYVRQQIGSLSARTQSVAEFAPGSDSVGRLDFSGAQLLGDSLGGGGTLSLRALDLQIGGDAALVDPRTLYLSPDFFTDRGFGAYDLSAELDATIAAGTQVRVTQRNLIPDVSALAQAATGADLYSGAFGELGTLDSYHRPATDFSLRAGDFVGRVNGNPSPNLAGATGTLLMEEGASLLLDPGASVRLGSRNQLTVLGSIVAHGGNITLSADSAAAFGEAPPPASDLVDVSLGYSTPSKSLWLGANAVLDVSGVSLVDPLAAPISTADGQRTPRTGRVLDGGDVTLSSDTGYLVVESGASIDLSGAVDRYDIPQAGSVGTTLVSQDVWSDAGTLTLAAGSGAFFDGNIRAHAPAEGAAGGTLVLRSINSSANAGKGILFHQDGSLLPQGLRPGDAVEPDQTQPSGIFHFAAERLEGSGVDTLIAGSNPDRLGDQTPLPIGFAGDVTLAVDRAIQLNASSYVALAEGANSFADVGEGGAVNLDAAYVSLAGFRDPSLDNHTLPTDLPVPGAASLSVDAQLIDLGGQFSLANFGTTNFTSAGDIRFYTPARYSYTSRTTTPFVGQLLTAGDINFTASQLYPATDNAFAVVAVGGNDPATGLQRETTISVAGNGRSADAPLSAAGTLLFDATHIEQQGTIRAPAGRIVLGVDDANDAATRALFGNLPLVNTESVHLAEGSRTSVSLEGQTVPWGVTLDQVDWQNHANPFQQSYGNVTAPPEKQIDISGTDVVLDTGATIDLKGGGELYAQEWIPGTGGSRDLLSRTNTVYSGDTRTDVPLYADGRQVYAIVPGNQSIAAPYDPSFDTGGSRIGQSVYLSGMNGVPEGVYTLMPAKYATLPGAYRVVQDTSARDIPANQNAALPDGTLRMSGHFVDGLTGTRNARSTAFLVQERDVWGQYSEYAITNADTFFTNLSAQRDSALPQLMRDAGRLTLSATRSLGLDATLETAAGEDGVGAQVDIASERIQIAGDNTTARDGYLQLDASDLSSLGAASLLIGGVRSQNGDGVTIDAQTSSLIVSNDASSTLTAPEILLVTDGGAGRPDDGLHLESGSAIRADGAIAASASVPITIGREADAANGITAISGDGALLRLSNGAPVLVTRHNVTGTGGLLQIDGGVTLDGGVALSLDATGDTRLAPTALLSAQSIDANSSHVTLVADAAQGEGRSGLVIGPQTLAQFSNAENITLRSRGDLDFVGPIDVALADASLSLSAGRFVGDGNDVHLDARTLTIANELDGSASQGAVSGAGTLRLDSQSLLFGAGETQIAGFNNVVARATQTISGEGTGSADFGAADVTLTAPTFVAGNVAATTVKTAGAINLTSDSTVSQQNLPVGGSLTFVGGTVEANANFAAPSGRIALRATEGDLVLGEGTSVDVSGVAKEFFDVTRYAPGGAINLTSDLGNVRLASGATLDFSGAEGGGDAGSLSISAVRGGAQLDGSLQGNAVAGQRGGSFTLDTGRAPSLDALTEQLRDGGIDGAIAIQARSGNLQLSAGHTLTAQSVKLSADGGTGGSASQEGHILIAGTIDASGVKGGEISLYGKSGVDVQGTLRATASGEEERGGTVRLYTSGVTNGTYNASYGYQNVTHEGSGRITLGAASVIDVSGNGGLLDGAVQIRAPLLDDGDVNVSADNGTRIVGAREVGLEAYAVWSTTDATSGSQHFDGIVDPAGWYDNQGQLLPGTFTDQNGNPLGTTGDLSKDYYTPDAANVDHVGFYQGTLADFVQQPGFTFEDRFAHVDNFVARPGVELQNPSPQINGGKISVLTNWNLGATDADGNFHYRYANAAPVLTLRSANSVDVQASITDGFKQYANPFGSVVVPPGSTLEIVTVGYDNALASWTGWGVAAPAPLQLPATFTEGDPEQIAAYYGYYQQYVDYLNSFQPAFGDSPIGTLGLVQFLIEVLGLEYQTYPGQPAAPVLPASPLEYPTYLESYQQYLQALYDIWMTETGGGGNFPTVAPPLPPQAILFDPADSVQTENLIAPMPYDGNPVPLHTGNIIAGESSSYRIVAGSDFTSTDPLAVLQSSAEQLAANATDVRFDGHFSFVDTDSGRTVELPTLLRTGTGNIEIAAGGDIRMDDPSAPTAIYSAGRLSGGEPEGAVGFRYGSSPNGYSAALLSSGGATPVGGGNVALTAGRDIVSNQQLYDEDGSITNLAGSYIGQYWWQWMQTANTETASAINFGAFGQGVMSIGGDVSIAAGRDIRELSVSLPTTWTLAPGADGQQQLNVLGGGDLSVNAGRDILSGDYFVSKGEGSLSAGGRIGSSFTLTAPTGSTPVATILGLQDANLSVSAAQGVEIGGIFNPSYARVGAFFSTVDSQAYSTDSSLSIQALSGDVALSTITQPGALFGYGSSGGSFEDVLPASLEAVALNGSLSIEAGGLMFPSSSGNLELIAAEDLRLFSGRAGASLFNSRLTMADVDAAVKLPSPLRPLDSLNFSGNPLVQMSPTRYEAANLHRDDPTPARLYALNGDIVSGVTDDLGVTVNALTLRLPKPAVIQAGRDIADLDLRGQNYRDSDITRIEAGRDIYYTSSGNEAERQLRRIELAGPGTLDVTAGRNLGPLTSEARPDSGIRTTGNTSNAGLPYEGADISLRFGVAPGIAIDEFAALYLDPSQHQEGLPDYSERLIAYMQSYFADHPEANPQGDGATNAETAWAAFQQLPRHRRQLLVQEVFLDLLKQVGLDYNDPESAFHEQYARGYEAINALFPAGLGYTANALDGGSNGAEDPVETGNLDIRGSTIQTRRGGDISILGPGGQILVGSASAPPVVLDDLGRVLVGPSEQGILTMERGDIGIFSDRSTLLAQSRVFAQQGGDILMWSSNGDINAGEGAKTTSEKPPVTYDCDPDRNCRVDPTNQVTGAGIATLQTLPDAEPGDAVLVAPRGTVDAGDAGIRVSGNLVIAAFSVANADNIQVQGDSVGVPSAAVNVGALSSASSAAAAAQQSADALANQRPPERAASMISVEVVGLGKPSEEQERKLRDGQ